MSLRQLRNNDEGFATLFVVIMATALMLVIGLVVDGGAVASARAEALDEATAAGRAAAQMIDADTLLRDNTVILNPEAAKKAAQDYIASTGDKATVHIEQELPGTVETGAATSGPSVTVSVTRTVKTQFLFMVGFSSISQTVTATVRPETGRLS
ncbi:hypothetical protein KGQ19_00620 [Catenulispora sp. NL8]|uniref:Flp pilus-assembly TadG-like N-terminal domain-containing protein n=1 Tax=Catenulispora pinistramenti TaxID=2705254 RepID=A0ABS5KH52_9ACTN|nr:hypothetical protein [Catenulispora pinistramenti]MBS2545362.1 hypothetical protein [Catenulispora pinistramenti]